MSKGLKKIEDYPFSGCEALKTINLPAGISKIASTGFDGCANIEAINVPAKKGDYYKQRLTEELQDKIVELEPEKKTKAKK